MTAEKQPLLLIVDDLPWLDRASALVLGMVARRLNGLPVGMVAACRGGEPGFFDLGGLAVVYVDPLSEEAATELLTSRYPVMTPRVRRRLLDAARGNPLALLELPVSLGDLAHTVAGALPAALPLSHRLQSVFASRVRALPAPVVELLLLAALDGTGDLRLIRAIDTDHGGGALHMAERSGLVRADESGERLTFRHPLIQSAIVDLSTSEQRRRAHAELAARLADRPERHAWHLAEATEEPDEKVAALLKQVAIANLRRGDSVGAHPAAARRPAQPARYGPSGRLAEAAYLGSLVTGDLRDAPRLLEEARLAGPGPRTCCRWQGPAPSTSCTVTATSPPAATRRPSPTSPPPATAASSGSPRACAWWSWPPRPSPPPVPTPPPWNRRSPNPQRSLALRPGPHPVRLRLAPAPCQTHHRRSPAPGERVADLPPSGRRPLGRASRPGITRHRRQPLDSRHGSGLPHPAATPDRPARGGGPHQQGDRRPPVPVAADGLHPPLPGVSQARHHRPRGPARRPRRPGRHRVSHRVTPT